MMGVPPSEAKRLTWWEYQAMLWTWNDRHTPEEAQPVEAPADDFLAKRIARGADRGLFKVLH